MDDETAQAASSAAPSRALRVTLSALGVVLVLLLVGVVAVAVFADRVSGVSMQPTLHNGDRFLLTPGTGGSAHRFDVIVANRPDVANTEIVKRVIAVPGDGIEIGTGPHGEFEVLVRPGDAGSWYRVAGAVWDGQAATPAFCCTAAGKATGGPDIAVVPKDRYFVLGDNPADSADSRSFGWLTGSAIKGRIGMRVWPLSDAGGIGNRPRLVAVPRALPEPDTTPTSSHK